MPKKIKYDSAIYCETEAADLRFVTDQSLRYELDRRCKGFTEAKTRDELSALYENSKNWLTSVTTADNCEITHRINAILASVSSRMAVTIAVSEGKR